MDTELLGRSLPVVVALLLWVACGLADVGSGPEYPPASGRWVAAPDRVRDQELPRHRTVYDGPEPIPQPGEPPYAAIGDATAASFRVTGDVPSLRAMEWSLELPEHDLSQYPYYILSYRAEFIERSHSPLPVLAAVGVGADGGEVVEGLLDSSQVRTDGLWHTVIGRKTLSLKGRGLRVVLRTSSSEGLFEFRDLRFHCELRRVRASLTGGPPRSPDNRGDWQSIDLGPYCNDTCGAALARVLEKEGLVTDGGTTLGDAPEAVRGVILRVPNAGDGIIRPAEDTSADGAPAEFLGHQTTRHLYEPPGRDDVIGVPVGRQVSEVVFAMVAELPQGGPHYAISPRPYDFSDMGALAVELRYVSGDADWAFPYSIADGGFAVRRMCGAYVVSADPARTLQSMVLHNRLPGKTFSLAAVSVNCAPARAFSLLGSEPQPLRVPPHLAPAGQEPYVRREGDTLKLGNGAYEVTVDCGQGFGIRQIDNRLSRAGISLHPSSGLAVRVGDIELTGRAFATQSVTPDDRGATIRLRSTVPVAPLDLTVRLWVDDTPQLGMSLEAVNTGNDALRADVRFPDLRGVSIGSTRDTWLFFPQYRNVLTDEPGHWQVANDRSFPLQFLDIHNPRAGAGVALLTHNRDNARLEYAIAKDSSGVSAFVQTPARFCEPAPGKKVTFTEACLVSHGGDWHEAMAAYREWLGTWYRPVHAQDKDWLDRRFWLKTYLTTNRYYNFAFPVYQAETGQYRVDEILRADEDYMGLRPDIAHLGGWCDFSSEYHGDFLGGDYAVDKYTGGADKLRAAIDRFQDQGVAVSLYTIPDRCSKQSEVGRRLGEKIACVRADGSLLQDEQQWYLCPAVKLWQDHYVEAIRRTQQETGANAIYVDVFGYYATHLCYSPDHGHEIPANTNTATLELIRRLRQVLPDDVALWSEYPLPDQCAAYIDGNIHYYCLNWHEFFSATRDRLDRAPACADTPQNAYRFVFPHLRQFIFPCGSENWSHESQFAFYNGEGLYDMGWFLYAGPHLDRMRKSLRLQRQFADCFSCDAPQMDVPTERGQVHANAFPGASRTVWTIYNARFATVRGTVLAVEHYPGATYRDLWNDRLLEPEVVDGRALLAVDLAPQGLGCVVQERP